MHQEDLCQALSVDPTKKYQSDGGPGIADLARLLASSMSTPTLKESTHRLFDYLVYNVAIGATDAHAKNFSVLLGPGDARLAPLYDVASVLPYDQEPDARSAFKIGSTWELSRVCDEDWATVGRQLGIGRDEAIHRADVVRLGVPAAFQAAAVEARIPAALRERAARIAELVTAQVEHQRDQWGRVAPPRP